VKSLPGGEISADMGGGTIESGQTGGGTDAGDLRPDAGLFAGSVGGGRTHDDLLGGLVGGTGEESDP